MVEAAYVGNRGVHLPYGEYNWNAIPTRLAAEAQGRIFSPYLRNARYPSGIMVSAYLGSSMYHSLQAKVERRMKAGLSLIGADTLAKLIATGDSGYRDPLENRNLDCGVPASTAPHRLTAAYVHQSPWGRGRHWFTRGWASQTLSGWEASGITTLESGYSLTPTSSLCNCRCGAANAPELICAPRLSSSERSLNRWFNTDAFAFPALYTVGDSGRGLFLGPGTVNMDLALMKRFPLSPLGERGNLEVRAEFFGLTDTPQFGNPNLGFGGGTFGRITGASGARQAHIAMKLYW